GDNASAAASISASVLISGDYTMASGGGKEDRHSWSAGSSQSGEDWIHDATASVWNRVGDQPFGDMQKSDACARRSECLPFRWVALSSSVWRDASVGARSIKNSSIVRIQRCNFGCISGKHTAMKFARLIG